jgi:hypoxanthine phosphoribosyltransferase
MKTRDLCCEVISWPRFAGLARRLAHKIRAAGYQPDLIVAIARGGYAPARVLADYLDVSNVASIKVEHYHGTRKTTKARVRHRLPDNVQGRRVLIVDDVSDTGDTFEVAVPHVSACLPEAEIRTAVLLHKAACPQVPDFYARKVVKWRWIIFPWAVMEDLSAFLAAADSPIRSTDEFARLLAVKHQLRVAPQLLEDVLAMAGTHTQP